eukprot:CAMPEP_0115716750 /NCGR_PEP_ID=MMETSP0272-20121206/76494_1 /TAXON_ID=71861 /ORGANISM="Scrippsiella trochoidea, Strain CCMP3099" /LENGTH=56 /DNA_ID=CAMNT_0003159093 /DNA_START=23 /DNA_END=190 /DNA_ORIENTATION=+
MRRAELLQDRAEPLLGAGFVEFNTVLSVNAWEGCSRGASEPLNPACNEWYLFHGTT